MTVCCGTDHIEHRLVFTNSFEVHVLNSVDTAQNKDRTCRIYSSVAKVKKTKHMTGKKHKFLTSNLLKDVVDDTEKPPKGTRTMVKTSTYFQGLSKLPKSDLKGQVAKGLIKSTP